MAPTHEDATALSAADLALLRAAFENSKGQLNFDWEAAAAKVGIEAGGQAARKRFKRMCERLGLNILSPGPGSGAGSAGATPASGKKRGAAAATFGGEDTPTKRRKTVVKKPTPKKAIKLEAEDKDEDDCA